MIAYVTTVISIQALRSSNLAAVPFQVCKLHFEFQRAQSRTILHSCYRKGSPVFSMVLEVVAGLLLSDKSSNSSAATRVQLVRGLVAGYESKFPQNGFRLF